MSLLHFFNKLSATFLRTSYLSSFYPTPTEPGHDTPSSSCATTMISQSQVPSSPPLHMPLELVLCIIEVACFDDDQHQRFPFLQSCSLVCRSWSTASQRLLFSRVTLRSQQAFEAFIHAVDSSTAHGHVLRKYVTSMRVVLDNNQPSSLHQHSFALVVTVCPNLQELNIALFGYAEPGKDIIGTPDLSRLRRSAPSFDEQTISLLRSGPQITSLQFNNWSENQLSLFQLLDVWSHLEILSIGGTTPQTSQESLPPFACSLKELRLNFQTSPSVDFIKWLLHNSCSTFRHLKFEREPAPYLLEYLLNTHGRRLQSFSIPDSGIGGSVRNLQACEYLRQYKTETPIICPLLYKCLPGTLEHIAVALDRETPLNPLILFVKVQENLRSMTIQLWDGGNQNLLLSSLKIACAYRGVHLRITSDVHSFRSLATASQF